MNEQDKKLFREWIIHNFDFQMPEHKIEILIKHIDHYFLSRSGGVWVKAINQKPPDNKWPYEIVFRNITTKRVLDILSYWTEEKWELNDADQNGTPIGTLIPISEIEWLNESPAADKGDAIDGWIDIKKELPKNNDNVLVYYGGNNEGIEVAFFNEGDNEWQGLSVIYLQKITHWRPLPQPPQSK